MPPRIVCLSALSLLLLYLDAATASSCGDSAIPFSLEVLSDGQPVLGCARPSCFGWSPSGRPASNGGSFFRINQNPDGFFRSGPERMPEYGMRDPRFFRPQTAECEMSYRSATCSSLNHWVGGIAPLLNISAYPMTLQCCTYDLLTQSEDRGLAPLGPGQIFVGGEVKTKDGVQYAFDYIANIVKIARSDGGVKYDVSVRRFSCPPLGAGSRIASPSSRNTVMRGPSDRRYSPRRQPARAYQSELVNVDNPISLGGGSLLESIPGSVSQIISPSDVVSVDASPRVLDGTGRVVSSRVVDSNGSPVRSSSITENGVIEDIIREEAFQLGGSPNGFSSQSQVVSSLPVPRQQIISPPLQPQAPIYQPQAPVYQPQAVAFQPQAAGGGYQAQYPAYYGDVQNQFPGLPIYTCFTGDTLAHLIDGSTKRMDQLNKGDWIASVNSSHGLDYSPVSFWLHRVPSQLAQFLLFTLRDGRQLKITSFHYIYKGDCKNEGTPLEPSRISRKAVLAETIIPGDCLYVAHGRRLAQMRVTSVAVVEERGIFAPMTASGRLLVNGVYASCHSVVQSHSIQHSFFHYIQAATRIYRSLFGGDDSITETPSGLRTWVEMLDLMLPSNLITN